jgi:sugar-specific transcriptional regulator TrmB
MMAQKIDKPIKNFLLDFGLTDKEVNAYLTLLKTGPNTIMNLARETGIKRSTTHNTVEELIKKGLVSQTNYGERRMVVAEDPKKLDFLMEQKKWEMKKLEDNLPDIVKSIYDAVPKAKENAKVSTRFYEGKEGALLIYKEAFNSKELRSYVNLSAVYEVFPENSEIYLASQKKNPSLEVKEIVDNSKESIKIAENFTNSTNFKFKLSPGSMNLSAIDVLIYDDNVALINFKESIFCTVIDNKDYYENAKNIFDFVWNLIP